METIISFLLLDSSCYYYNNKHLYSSRSYNNIYVSTAQWRFTTKHYGKLHIKNCREQVCR